MSDNISNEKDIHDQVLVVFRNPDDNSEIEITIMELVNSGTPCNETSDYDYVRVIRKAYLNVV